jgi:hypothetical protein
MSTYKKYRTVGDMQKAIDEYFVKCDEEKKPYTVTGLALALGFLSRQALLNYEGYTDIDDISFHDTIKAAKHKVEASIEEGLLSGKYNSVGSIFNLKNNFNWKDKTEVENTGEQSLNVNIKVMDNGS